MPAVAAPTGRRGAEIDGVELHRPGNDGLPDYIKLPSKTIPSFYCPIGEHVHISEYPRPATAFGFPIPGEQNPSATSVMAKDYFVTDATWSNILAGGKFDYIVIGSGCTALAFIDEVLKQDKNKRILCLERGETFPWTLSRKTYENKELGFCHGSCPFFGGRSTFWSAWSPQPSLELMRGFPDSMKKTAGTKEFWKSAKKLLHVQEAQKIGDGVFGALQEAVDKVLHDNLKDIPTADTVESAPLAVAARSPTSRMRFNKFSVPGPLLGLYEEQRKLTEKGEGQPLQLMLNCVVTGLTEGDDGVVRAIETNRGTISWPEDDTKIVLCAGAIPNATLLLNSFPSCRETVGKRITGHFLTHIAARCPIGDLPGWDWAKSRDLQIAATYLAGKDRDTNMQYHVQITAIHSPDPENDAEDAARECPDYAAAATYEQLKDSEKHVVFVCASLGEFYEFNEDNFVQLNNGKDQSTNVKLQFTLHENDSKLWDVMDEATYQTIEVMSGGETSNIEYWDVHKGKWVKERQPKEAIRIPGIVHESSTAFVGPRDEGGSLDETYRPHGVKNVYVTGGAIFPSAGSWNPTLTMCGFAQDLARKI